MPAGTYNIVADAGADYLVTFTYEDTGGSPIDLAGYTAAMTFAPQFGSTELLLELISGTNANMAATAASGITSLTVVSTAWISAGTIYVVTSLGIATYTVTSVTSGTVLAVTFVSQTGGSGNVSTGLVTWPTAGIVITPLAGQLACTITDDQTTALWAASPAGAWMLNIIDGGGVITRLVQGAYTVNAAAPSGT